MNNRHPRRMPGMAAMMAQSAMLDLSAVGNLNTQPGASAVDTSLMPGAPQDTDKAARGLEMLVRLAKAEQQVANVNKVIAAFAEQSEQLPEDHHMRVAVAQMLRTFRDAIAAVHKR